MKNLIYIFSLLLALTTQAQSVIYTLGDYISANPRPPAGKYIKDINNLLDKFVGTWKFEQNGKSLEITLQKIIKAPVGDSFTDELQGTFVYKENNVEIVNTQNLINTDAYIYGKMVSSNNPNKIKLFFRDPGRPKVSCVVFLNYSSYINNVKKLDWKLVGVALLPFEENEVAPTDIRIIKECVLTKQ
jgi:hypothetical protein